MCEMDSNIRTESYQENSSEGRADEHERLCFPEEPHFSNRSNIENFCSHTNKICTSKENVAKVE